MLKPPITLPIARSKYQCACHVALAAGLVGVASLIVPLWAVAGCSLLLLFLVFYQYQNQPSGDLQLMQNSTQLSGRWLLVSGELGAERPVRCDYIGPWLVGLYIGPQRLWLWPDSLPAHSHRALRRLCHRPGH